MMASNGFWALKVPPADDPYSLHDTQRRLYGFAATVSLNYEDCLSASLSIAALNSL